jgi:hypothetical protein
LRQNSHAVWLVCLLLPEPVSYIQLIPLALFKFLHFLALIRVTDLPLLFVMQKDMARSISDAQKPHNNVNIPEHTSVFTHQL